MATQLQRTRIPPQWKGGLRRGTVRDTMTAYLAEHPDFSDQLLAALRQVRAQGYEPVPMNRIKQPFDYQRS